ncbi:heterokaryon incompatibility protein [Apiospora saccharicola]
MSQLEHEHDEDPGSPDIGSLGSDWEDYDLQIALDQLGAGSTDALKLFLARREGVDPNTVSLRSTPWHAGEEDSLSFIGGVDNIHPPGEEQKDGLGNEEPLPSRRIALEDTGTPYEYSGLDSEARQFRLLKLSEPGDEDGISSFGMADFQPMYTGDAYSSTNVQSAVSIMTFLTRTWTVGNQGKTLSDAYWDKTSLPDPETREGRRKWRNLLNFWSQDWYFRTWVLQEIVLAAKVVVLYHDTAISLDAIMEFWSLTGSQSLPRPLRIGPLADTYNRVRHLSPVGSIKSLLDRRNGRLGELEEGGDVSTREGLDDDKASPPSLLELLCLSRSNLATDPRDKVYGLLGLADDAISRSIVPDYSPANTADKLFTEVASRLVISGCAGDLLHHAGRDRTVSGLPSWVPDWTKQSRATLPVHLYQCMGTATTPKCSILSTEEEEGKKPKLRVRGVIISQITIVGAPWKFYSHDPSEPSFGRFKNAPDEEIAPEPPLNDEDARNLIFNMITSFEEDIGDRYAEEGFQDAVARTLAADCSWQGHRIGRRNPELTNNTATTPIGEDQSPGAVASPTTTGTPGDEFFAGLAAFRRFYARGPESAEDLEAPGIRVHQTGLFMWLLDFDEEVEADLQHRMVPFTAPLQEAQRGRRFAVLGKPSNGKAAATDVEDKSDDGTGADEKVDNHFMGTVPWDAENGDYCVLLEGFRTPFILRKRGLRRGKKHGADGTVQEEEFGLVGDCYVHGVMDGELLRWADEVGEELGPEFCSVNDEGREYTVQAPQGCVPFRDFILI